MKKKSVAVVIVSNGPGELATWVSPLVNELNKISESLCDEDKINFTLRLVLVPCPNATGKEFLVAKSWNKFELITKSKSFWKLLLKPHSFANWPKKGIVIFLGGDQFWSILLAKRLGYLNITYAEWISRWPQWTNVIAAMNAKVKELIPKRYKYKCQIIGDLMADIKLNSEISLKNKEKHNIALLPGSKKAKLSIGIPFFLEVADHIAEENQNINFIIPIAPTTNKSEYLFFQSERNPISKYYSSKIKTLKNLKDSRFDYEIETSKNTKIYLIKKHPCYEILKECDIAITTVGANTSELAAIALPMLVVLPTQHLNMMNAWDGIIGIIGKISLINRFLTFIIRYFYFKKKKFFAWPNIKAKRMIVPERIGNFSPKKIAREVLFLIKNKDQLKNISDSLQKERGNKGAAKKLASIIANSIKKL
ncbi:glycosyl transferase [Prochlorococcus marinus XMU1411]|uniref:glycosyl transferase n=1 Tax=Prochlorococcus marinus TaxID=1219 RepID=UPI001ADC349E|nr:glycosyl transferase [Prochlorococcus marinus]MBO8242933.1 glycosyl transferase [Prochlorococcus marinus XMU1411]MBW3054050.1 glycosyl transferase [Prochlorococcus marinus str. MU1411]MCR8537622.1 glycosyl transferase [Prochlorococcus marinus CUG1430]